MRRKRLLAPADVKRQRQSGLRRGRFEVDVPRLEVGEAAVERKRERRRQRQQERQAERLAWADGQPRTYEP